MLTVGRLIDRIVACNPRITAIPRRDLFPQPDGSVLVILEVPEGGVGGWVITVPALIVPAWKSMHIEDRIYTFFCTLNPMSERVWLRAKYGLMSTYNIYYAV